MSVEEAIRVLAEEMHPDIRRRVEDALGNGKRKAAARKSPARKATTKRKRG